MCEIMKSKIKVTLEYWGQPLDSNVHQYRIARILGAPTIEVRTPSAKGCLRTTRIGELISEDSATELSQRVETATIPKPAQ